MQNLEIALIGCGRIGFLLENDKLRNKPCTHYGGIVSNGLKVTHACDIKNERLDKFRNISSLDERACYNSHADLFRDTIPDCAVISTDTPSHFKITCDAISAGVKVIVLEKPVSSSLTDSHELINLAKKNNTTVLVNHERRYDPRYILVGKILSEKKIGNITSVYGRIGTGPYRGNSKLHEGGGPLLHDGTHLIDIILYYFGPCRSLSGKFTRSTRLTGFEDTAHAWMKLENGIDAFIESGGSRKYFNFEIDIWGTEGRVTIGNGINRLYLAKTSELYEGFRDLKEIDFPTPETSNCFTNLYSEVKAILSGEKIVPKSSLEDGYSAMEVIHGVYYSSHKKGKEIKLPLSPGKINLKKIFSL